MTPQEIIKEIKSMGGKNITFKEDGLIISEYGRSTVNYWVVINKKLKCIDCRTIYSR